MIANYFLYTNFIMILLSAGDNGSYGPWGCSNFNPSYFFLFSHIWNDFHILFWSVLWVEESSIIISRGLKENGRYIQ